MTSRRALFLATATTVIIALLHLAECTSIAGNPHAKGGGGGSTAVRIHQQHLDPFLHGDVGGGGGSGLPSSSSSSSSSSSAGHSYQKMRHPNDIMATLNSLMSPNRIGKKRKRFSLKDFSFGETKAFAHKSIPRSSSGQGQQLVVGTGKGEKKGALAHLPPLFFDFLPYLSGERGGNGRGTSSGVFLSNLLLSLPFFRAVERGGGRCQQARSKTFPSHPSKERNADFFLLRPLHVRL